MPTYSFRCEAGCLFDATFRMAEVPAQTVCRECGAEATRVITTPHLSAAGTSAFRMIDSAARSAHEPPVVTSLPKSGRARTQRVTHNPLHAKLPRP